MYLPSKIAIFPSGFERVLGPGEVELILKNKTEVILRLNWLLLYSVRMRECRTALSWQTAARCQP